MSCKGVHELVSAQQRMAKGVKESGTKEKERVRGWSTEEMKEKANNLLEEGTEEMRTWRELSQEEIDRCWKRLAERMEEEEEVQVQG